MGAEREKVRRSSSSYHLNKMRAHVAYRVPLAVTLGTSSSYAQSRVTHPPLRQARAARQPARSLALPQQKVSNITSLSLQRESGDDRLGSLPSLRQRQRQGLHSTSASASASDRSENESGGDDLYFGFTALICVQSLWLVSGLLGTWAFGAWPYGKDAGYYFLGFGQTTALLIPQLASSIVLRSASLRNRLSGTTFKVLNLSLFASSVLLFVAELFQSISEGGIGFKTLSATLTAAVSYLALRRHGLPEFKFSTQGAIGKVLTLAQAYFILTVWTGALVVSNSVGSGLISFLFGKVTREVILEPHHFITFAALLAIQAGTLHTLQSAAVAGEKRLSSDTYKKLNLGGILSAISALLGICWAAKMKCQVLWVFLTLGTYNLAQLAACAYGFFVGSTFKQ